MRFFEDKAVAVLNEQLTSRLRAQGCGIVDATWLATRAGQSFPAARPLGAIPDWRVQVTSRDTDAASAAILP